MLLKRASVIISSHGGIHSIPHSNPPPITTSSSRPTTCSETSCPHRVSRGQKRGHAQDRKQTQDDNDEATGAHCWPEVPPLAAHPSPYQIFNQKKGAPYSKRRFYDLVKLYHPDRANCSRSDLDSTGALGSLSHAVRVERYRLIVAANDILSDPIKRSAYDRYGAGWNGHPEAHDWRQNQRDARTQHHGGSYRTWHSSSGDRSHPSPHQNATWEDWERWYAHTSGSEGPQQPLYFANGAFVAMIVMLAALGGIGQAARAGSHSAKLLEERDRVHDESSRDLMRRRRESRESLEGERSAKEERVMNFLKSRWVAGDAGGEHYLDGPEGFPSSLHSPASSSPSSSKSSEDR